MDGRERRCRTWVGRHHRGELHASGADALVHRAGRIAAVGDDAGSDRDRDAYGLVLDVDRDSVADYEVGLSNQGRRRGQFRAWLTNLASGANEEQVGPPYGFPVEFSHPDEGGPGFDGPTVVLTFLEAPEGVSSRTVRFYAWASHTEAGEVVAWDYAPDARWLGAPPPRELGCTEAACPLLGPPPQLGARELLVQVSNEGQRRALLFVAEDRSPMADLVGTAEPALILPGARELVTFTVPAGSGWAIFVNPTEEHSGPLVVAPFLPPDGFEIVITDDGGFVSHD